MARLFSCDGNVIGFDGSQMNSVEELETEMKRIFENHPTGTYVGIVREIRMLSEDMGLLRAVAGMIPRGEKEIKPEVNAVQSMVAGRTNGVWKIELLQNTPAAFHGRPEKAQELTEELRAAGTRITEGGRELTEKER